ncbi:uncharacterized protein JN550_006154 [Neoarthrinium moseri]|uniref:uncharacterized protein n=1 Tax=Neoarthrinium moseri TaxID=1658444 RepID=UPI001FDBFBDC|nr:uncharacterized protein JN550_006154 [Neoarthrinium moseri]KAI1868579.1 hypothetical protein JN550_006154 [Neoarthrinium moseri]
MASSKKRKRTASVDTKHGMNPAIKKSRHSTKGITSNAAQAVKHAVLDQYFTTVLTLRNYMLLKLPSTSRIRRRKISSVNLTRPADTEVSDVERSLGALLDSTLVGVTDQALQADARPDNRWKHWTDFSQRGDDSHVTLSDGLAGAEFCQSEIVDFVIWLLFSKSKTHSGAWPKHILCDGFRRDPKSAKLQGPGVNHSCSIPGLFSLFPNPQVNTLKEAPWPQLLKLLGKCGDRIMMDLLLDCAIFTSVRGGQGNYCQISGYPLTNAEVLLSNEQRNKEPAHFERSPSDIIFVRNRMLYARAALNARGLVHFGLRHIHVLNRAPYVQLDQGPAEPTQELADRNKSNSLKVMMYIFPRQFGLHNAFTSKIDYTETAQRFKDYTLRENEISDMFGAAEVGKLSPKVPKRLRGEAKDLIQKLQILHTRCSYSELLQYYCPVSTPLDGAQSSQSNGRVGRHTQASKGKGFQVSTQLQSAIQRTKTTTKSTSIVELSTSAASVSAFCQAAVSKILPVRFFGSGEVQRHNRSLILKKVDQFIRLRRFESMSLHEVMQGMRLTEIEWLAPPRLLTHKTSQTDISKRAELFYEFLYYIFDSIVIPLLRSNFYITESNTDKCRLFFFRHDIWRYVAEPVMATLKAKMFEEVSLEDANRILDSRQLGFSQVRLLPKGHSVRPIMNLRKKMVTKGNQRLLGPSINTLLKPVHNVLQLEKSLNPGKLGSAMFSVGDMYKRIKTFKARMGTFSGPLYFAKVDVQSAFDTIPQSAIVGLLDSIPQRREYQIAKHVELSSTHLHALPSHRLQRKPKPLRKWHSTAMRRLGRTSLFDSLGEDVTSKKNTIFIESVFKKIYDTSAMLQLVSSHIQQNLVKIGKKFYRQKDGIPQGSVLSSTLCNYFYADLEIQVLRFLDSEDCLLLRLIDDFLLITADRSKASRFVEVMHRGVPEYGVTVNPAKTLVNFDLELDAGSPVSKVHPRAGFPYCGTLIYPATLNITRDRHIRQLSRKSTLPTMTATATMNGHNNKSIFNSLTVEHTRTPGQTFERKVLNAFKIQSHLMYLDTSLNAPHTVLASLHAAFAETAAKAWAYARCLGPRRRPAPRLVVRAVQKLAAVAFLLATSRARRARHPGYACDVRRTEVACLAYCAFAEVLGRKQAGYGEVLDWLRAEIARLSTKKEIRQGRVSRVAAVEQVLKRKA